ncbi:hypothetical protein [Nocardia puris]|uniref:PPE family protein n=1 Tax=Nocardia puris TaxID=208602 RepID=A0A366DWH0_9NOCA|nr:hypothetical protein [Nocardia puris]RBO94265.1 hypothetical protein DFR74_102688 [Nocardia puris]
MADPYININDNPAALGVFMDGKGPDVTRPSERSRLNQEGAEKYESDLTQFGEDPAYITRMEQFEGHTHAEIYANAQLMNPGLMHQQADSWMEIGHSLSGGLLGTHLAIQSALAEGIEGQMADAALASAQQFYKEATGIQQVINTTGTRIKAVAHAAEVVKTSVPPPVAPYGQNGSEGTLDPAQIIIAAFGTGLVDSGASEQVAYERGAEALYRAAIDTMNNSYKPSYGPAGTGVPTFTPVTVPGTDDPGNGGNGPGTNGPGTGNPGGSGTPSENQETPGENDESTNPAGDEQDSPADTQPSGTGTTTDPANNSTTPASTTPSGTQPSTPTTPTTPGTGNPSTPGPGPGGGPGPGVPGPGSPGQGRSVTGAPTGLGSTAAAANAANRAPGAGRAGMPGMMAPGTGRGKDDNESNRQIPDYLIGVQEELLGTPEPTVPQAIGDDAPANRPDFDGEQR